MVITRSLILATAALAAGLIAAPAAAQRSMSTIRVAFTVPVPMVDLYLDPKPENGLTRKSNSVADPAKRKAVARKLFERMTTQALVAPLIASSRAFVRAMDKKIKTGAYMSDFVFK